MIGGDSPHLGGERRSAAVGELVGVKLRPKAVLDPRGEDGSALLHRERALLAEGVAEACDAALRGGGDDLGSDQLDEVLSAPPILLGESMRSEQCRDEVDRVNGVEPRVQPESPQFLLDR